MPSHREREAREKKLHRHVGPNSKNKSSELKRVQRGKNHVMYVKIITSLRENKAVDTDRFTNLI